MMRTPHFYREAMVFLCLAALANDCLAAADDLDRIKQDIVGSWLVDVDTEKRLRTLNITGAEAGPDGTWTLENTYGWTDGDHSSISARLTVKPESYSLQLTTKANVQVLAEYAGANTFKGTFDWNNGKTRKVRLDRLLAEEMASRTVIAKTVRMQSIFKPPGVNVPAACAGFLGGWTGIWPGYGQTWLWVVDVNADCVAKCTNRSTSAMPDHFQACEIKEGVLSRSKPEGMEYYELRGAELWARFAPTTGAQNTAVFKKYRPE